MCSNVVLVQKISCLLLLLTQTIYSQNLVPNPSFEDANCPTGYTGWPAQVELYLQHWYSANCASADPMTNCSSNANTSVPDVWFGHQHARTGTNYMGVGFYGSWYEYIGVKLTQPLISGEEYHVSFFTSLAEQMRYASDALGIYFSTTEIRCYSGFGGPTFTNVPQIVQTPGIYLTDSIGWTEVSGTFTATGGEEYIVLGCFKPWSIPTLHDLGNSGLTRCYHYIDDISVVRIVPLSTHLVSFEASLISKETPNLLIQWETLNDENICNYIIERSSNGYLFDYLNKVTSQQSNSTAHYHYTDRNPLRGTSYYRLTSQDCSGKIVRSEIITIDTPYPEIELFPNPAHDEITIFTSNIDSFPITLSMYNTLGEKIISKEILSGQQVIDIRTLPSGIYILLIDSGEETFIQKINKY